VHGGDGFRVEVAQFPCEAVAERGLLRRKARGVQLHARTGDFGQGAKLVRVVPDQPEIIADLVDEAGRGRAAAAVFERGKISGRDGEGVRHVALEDFFRGPEGAEFFAEGGHERKKVALF